MKKSNKFISRLAWKQEFANRLRQAMYQRSINETVLAERANVSQPAISKYLAGECVPQSYNLYKICKVLSVSPCELMGV